MPENDHISEEFLRLIVIVYRKNCHIERQFLFLKPKKAARSFPVDHIRKCEEISGFPSWLSSMILFTYFFLLSGGKATKAALIINTCKFRKFLSRYFKEIALPDSDISTRVPNKRSRTFQTCNPGHFPGKTGCRRLPNILFRLWMPPIA